MNDENGNALVIFALLLLVLVVVGMALMPTFIVDTIGSVTTWF